MKIIAVDFDGTLCHNEWPNIGPPNLALLKYLRIMRSRGYKLILNTMREGEMLDKAVAWCKEHGLEFDAVNDNLPEMVKFFNGNPRKIFANYYFDDHNVLNFGVKAPIVRTDR